MRRHPRVVAGLATVVALVVIVGLLGGWSREHPGLRRVAPGETVALTPFTVRLESAAAVYELDGDIADEGLAYVVVDGEISLDDDESVESPVLDETFVADLPQTYDIVGYAQDDPEPAIQVSGDGSTLLGIGPGLTYDVRLVYSMAESDVPARLHLTLFEHSKRASTLDGFVGWLDTHSYGTVDLDVAPLPDERPVEDDGL